MALASASNTQLTRLMYKTEDLSTAACKTVEKMHSAWDCRAWCILYRYLTFCVQWVACLPQQSSAAPAMSADESGSLGQKASSNTSRLGLHLKQEWATATWVGSPSHLRVGGTAAGPLPLQDGTAAQVACDNRQNGLSCNSCLVESGRAASPCQKPGLHPLSCLSRVGLGEQWRAGDRD